MTADEIDALGLWLTLNASHEKHLQASKCLADFALFVRQAARPQLKISPVSLTLLAAMLTEHQQHAREPGFSTVVELRKVGALREVLSACGVER